MLRPVGIILVEGEERVALVDLLKYKSPHYTTDPSLCLRYLNWNPYLLTICINILVLERFTWNLTTWKSLLYLLFVMFGIIIWLVKLQWPVVLKINLKHHYKWHNSLCSVSIDLFNIRADKMVLISHNSGHDAFDFFSFIYGWWGWEKSILKRIWKNGSTQIEAISLYQKWMGLCSIPPVKQFER